MSKVSHPILAGSGVLSPPPSYQTSSPLCSYVKKEPLEPHGQLVVPHIKLVTHPVAILGEDMLSQDALFYDKQVLVQETPEFNALN